ncbi:D-xylose 1-dehydrogenase NADP(+) 2 [Scenedesmus sp. PABB004]|nr:D-xylose 1-dehydrogenase NADP(+) 2 [Scenedesmus sp. PABB004]
MPAVALAVALLAVASAARVFGAPAPLACAPGPGGAVSGPSCTWTAPLGASSGAVALEGALGAGVESATPIVFAAPGLAPAGGDEARPGMTLSLERLVLVGFEHAPVGPGSEGLPALWPRGLLSAGGAALRLTDVRLVTSSPEVFQGWLQAFAGDSRVVQWTDNATFVHVVQWADERTAVSSVGFLLQAAQPAPGVPVPPPLGPLALPPPHVRGAVVAATNASLVPALLAYAPLATPAPLLVYVTANVSLGARPPLPPGGVPVNRPVVFVGLASAVTSVDFQMVVNQLNETGSRHSNVTFVGLTLENVAPGDAVTSGIAAPFSIAIANNVWAAFYNRTAANEVRLALFNVTMVLPQESEMAYVTYMFTLFTSSLPYLRQQTSFYTDVLHISVLQFAPGPGSNAITVNRLVSWYHWWRNVVLTTKPAVAPALPLPPRQLVLSTTTRTSPLVQAVHSADDLRVRRAPAAARARRRALAAALTGGARARGCAPPQLAAESEVLGDRAHILLLLANITLPLSADGAEPPNGSAITLRTPMSWIGTSPEQEASSEAWPPVAAQRGAAALSGPQVHLGLGYSPGSVVLPRGADDDALQLQQLVLGQLPQGRGVAAALRRDGERIPMELWTVLLWAFKRPMKGRPLSLNGVALQLPGRELESVQSAAARSRDFVIELAGDGVSALTFQGVSQDDGAVHVSSLTGPGLVATNLTLLLDPAAASAMPGGYVWPDPGRLPVPVLLRGGLPAWATALIVVGAVAAAALAALAGAVWLRRRRGRAPALPCADCSKLLDSPAPHGRAGSAGGDNSGSGSCARHSLASSRQRAACASPGGGGPLGGTRSSVGSDARRSSGDTQTRRDVLVPVAVPPGGGGGAAAKDADEAAAAASSASHGVDVSALCDAPVPVHVADSLADSVAAGMQRWRAAVSSTTMLLMERRMDAAHQGASATGAGSCAGSGSWHGMARGAGGGSSGGCGEGEPGGGDVEGGGGARGGGALGAATGADALAAAAAGAAAAGAAAGQQLQLQELLGQGSCGCVYLATWRGKRVAVKVMQLPANALLGPQSGGLCEAEAASSSGGGDGGADALQRRRRARQLRCSPPHMAIMEAVLSSTMSHPNVVQVYTYMLNPLTTDAAGGSASGAGGGRARAAPAVSSGQDVSGWELRLVMEYCSEGSLRDALDCGLLCKPGSCMAPSAVLTLAHDVAAAMLHLHSEGIVHGDLKAGNVMLTTSNDDSGSSLVGGGARGWGGGSGGRPLTAKVADFGLAMPLGPADTHATLCARGTPTHMSPELFMAGHVSKASDVYAYGVLLYEIMTGQRAYAGVPIPLLPHEVARQGLRPTWPPGMPSGCRDLRRLAEACWAQQPQDRPSFAEILRTLDLWAAGCHGWPPAQPPAPAFGAAVAAPAGPAAQQQQQQARPAAAKALQLQVPLPPREPELVDACTPVPPVGASSPGRVATYALIFPAKLLPNVTVAAIAARDADRAAAWAARFGIPRSYGSWEELVADESLAAIYVATPNGWHGACTRAALDAGKHVLCEKPFAANAVEARAVQRAASARGLLCREAFHYREAPANKAVAGLLQGGAIGELRSFDVEVRIPSWAFGRGDIRFAAALAGGTMMDAGCYCAHALRFFPGCSRPTVTAAQASKLMDGGLVDGAMAATLAYPRPRRGGGGALGAGAVGRLEADLRHPGLWPRTRFVARGTKGRLEMDNFIMPFLGHTLTLTRAPADPADPRDRGGAGGGAREVVTKLAVYGSGESNYYNQLQRFVSDLRVLRDPASPKEAVAAVRRAQAADAADAVDNMALIDQIYAAAGLPRRRPADRAARGGAARG